MTAKQLIGTFLLCVYGALLGAIVAAAFFGLGFWLLSFFGFLERSDALFRFKGAVITFSILGFVFGFIRAVRMIH